jgi:DNA polymerase III subunit delta'
MVLCERPMEEPCGACRPCRQVQGLTHPDLHWVMPVPRPKAADPEKQIEELADAIGETIAERRANPLWSEAGGMAGHFVATARLLQRHAALTPVEGRKKLFLVAEADRLVPQESSQEAANALLKLLEEPPSDAQFILTVTDPNLLLPTVRSRAVTLRLGRLTDNEIRGFIGDWLEPKPAADVVEAMVRRAQGSIGQSLTEGEASARARKAAEHVLEAAHGDSVTRMERALRQGPWSARGDFAAIVDALAELLGEEARRQGQPVEPKGAVAGHLAGRGLRRLVLARERVLEVRELAQGNVNPQLLLATLEEELAEALWR